MDGIGIPNPPSPKWDRHRFDLRHLSIELFEYSEWFVDKMLIISPSSAKLRAIQPYSVLPITSLLYEQLHHGYATSKSGVGHDVGGSARELQDISLR